MTNVDKVLDMLVSGNYFVIFLLLMLIILVVLVLGMVDIVEIHFFIRNP